MVVDLRYHVASLVAVFLALGLGVLVGASLFGDASGSVLQEQLLAAVEREMDLLRADRRRVTSQLESAVAERDLYIDVTTELTSALMQGRLAGKSLTLVLVGEEDDTFASLESLVKKAGASVFAKVRMDGQSEDQSEGHADGLDLAEDDRVWVPEGLAHQDVSAIIALNGSPQQYATIFSSTVARLKRLGITKVIAVTRDDEWRKQIADTDVAFVSGINSPIGKLSTLLMLGSEEVGAYGSPDSLWPRHLLHP